MTTTLHISRDITKRDDRSTPLGRVDRTDASYKVWYFGSPPAYDRLFAEAESRFSESFNHSAVLDYVHLELFHYAPFLHMVEMRAGGHAAPKPGEASVTVIPEMGDLNNTLGKLRRELAKNTAVPEPVTQVDVLSRVPASYRVHDYVAIVGHGDWAHKYGLVAQVDAGAGGPVKLIIRLDDKHVDEGTPRMVGVYAHQVRPAKKYGIGNSWEHRFSEEDAAQRSSDEAARDRSAGVVAPADQSVQINDPTSSLHGEYGTLTGVTAGERFEVEIDSARWYFMPELLIFVNKTEAKPVAPPAGYPSGTIDAATAVGRRMLGTLASMRLMPNVAEQELRGQDVHADLDVLRTIMTLSAAGVKAEPNTAPEK